MKTNDYTTWFAVEQSPEDVFNAINNGQIPSSQGGTPPR